MRLGKYIAVLMLALLPSLAPAAMLTDMTPGSYSIPSGWSLVIKQDFEGALSGDENTNKSFATDRYHGGARSISSTIVGDANDDSWWLRTNRIGTLVPGNEVYVSWYEYVESGAKINDEYWLLQFLKRAPDDTMWQEIIVAWLWAGFNSPAAGLYIVPQTEVDNLGATWNIAGDWHTVPTGAWVQWEVHYKINSHVADPYNDRVSDGFLRVYKDGTLWATAENRSLNGNVDMSNMAVTIGGTYTKMTWMSGGSCSSAMGEGNDSGPRVTSFGPGNPCPCTNQCPPGGYVPTFKRYFDDVIIMKLTGSSGGTDTQPPYITNRSPASGATGVPTTQRTISLNVVDDRTDDDGVVQASIAMTVDNAAVTETISGSASNYLVTYVAGSDWTAGQVVPVTFTATDVAGNVLNSAWSFTVAGAGGPDNLAITTVTLPNGTVGTTYNQQLASTGGTAPVTYSMGATPYDPGGPYPPSTTISGVTFDFANVVTGAPGSDLWHTTWAGDNNVYMAWGDGGGQSPGTNLVCRTHAGLIRANGTPPSFTWTPIWGCKADGTGCEDWGELTHNASCDAPYGGTMSDYGVPDVLFSIDNTLYLINTASGLTGMKINSSSNFGQSWTTAAWAWDTTGTGFNPSGIASFGMGYAGARDNNVYMLGGKNGDLKNIYLARCPKTELMTQGSWEYFTGTYASPTWGTWANATSIHYDANRVGESGSTIYDYVASKVQYFPVIDRYILTMNGGQIQQLRMYDAPEPWGPWTTVYYSDSWGNYGSTNGLYYNIMPKFTNGTDTEFWMTFSGYNAPTNYDNYYLIKGTFTLASGGTNVLPAGLALSSSGAIGPGIPTAVGTTAFTVTATDSAPSPQTATKALSITINAATPGGQTTVTGTDIEDTWIDNNAPTANHSATTTLGTYDWPDFTVANQIILMDNNDIVALPDNISITSATLRLYLTAGGGYNPTNITAHRITGTVPDIDNVTWGNFAGTVGTTLSTVAATLTPGWVEWNVLTAVQAAYAAGDPVYLLVKGGTGTADTWRDFASAQHGTTSWVPQLVITYTQLVGPGGPSISAPGKLRVSKLKGRVN